MLRTTIIAALALTATPAAAQGPTVTPRSVRVQTADLDLSSQAGIAALDRRIKAAVGTVCPYRVNPDLPTLLAHRACAGAALRSAAKTRDALIAQRRPEAAEVASATR